MNPDSSHCGNAQGEDSALAAAMANFGHEFANPLNAIAISAELAKRMLARGRTADAADALGTIATDCERCARLLRDAQDYFSMDVGDVSGDVDLVALLDATMMWTSNRGKIGWRDPPQSSHVPGNERALTRLFRELTQNAFDHGAQSVQVDLSRESGQLRVCIRDDGPGIDPSVLPRIFDPFFSTTRQRQSGIGLPIARRIAHAHGGEVGAENHEQGMTFWVTLPAIH